MSYKITSNDRKKQFFLSFPDGRTIIIDYPLDIKKYKDISSDDLSIIISGFIPPDYADDQIPDATPEEEVVKVLNASITPNTGIQGDSFTVSWEFSNVDSITIFSEALPNSNVVCSDPTGNVTFKQIFRGNNTVIVKTNEDNPKIVTLSYVVEQNPNIVDQKASLADNMTKENPYGQRLEEILRIL